MYNHLYPPLEPYLSGLLALNQSHVMYWEISGNPNGLPVLFLHGGPGAGASPVHRQFFDPTFYRIVMFDQRGCGRSFPRGELVANTTHHLVDDIEALRQHLNIERWLVFGGSWGSTLAIAYGTTFPDRCLGFILRGIFLASQKEIEWLLTGTRTFFPESWRAFVEHLPKDERKDLLVSYYRRLTDPNPHLHMPAAYAWNRHENACSTLLPAPSYTDGNEQNILALARIEAHYYVHQAFIAESPLIERITALRDHRAMIIQGRYDMVCPIITADLLARTWSDARYIVVPDAGHSAFDRSLLITLIDATNRFRDEAISLI